MAQLGQTQLAQIVSAVIQGLQVQGAASTKPAPQAAGNSLEAKDRRLANTFSRRGFKPIILMDRNDPSKDYNIRPYKGWIKLGRVVRKGERSVFGLFHIDQTDVIPAKPAPAPKGKLFGKAKAKPHVVA